MPVFVFSRFRCRDVCDMQPLQWQTPVRSTLELRSAELCAKRKNGPHRTHKRGPNTADELGPGRAPKQIEAIGPRWVRKRLAQQHVDAVGPACVPKVSMRFRPGARISAFLAQSGPVASARGAQPGQSRAYFPGLAGPYCLSQRCFHNQAESNRSAAQQGNSAPTSYGPAWPKNVLMRLGPTVVDVMWGMLGPEII